MGRMRIALAAVVVALVGGMLPVRAASTCTLQPSSGRRFIDIAVLEQGFSPFTQQAFAGDVIRWTVGGASRHIIAPYAPATTPGFGVSPELVPGDVYCIAYSGGSVWYRDSYSQSSHVDPVSKVCQGRCASISDRTTEPAAPTITPPSGPSEQRPTPVRGTSEPLTLVKLADVPAGETAYDKGTPVGQALADETGAWQVNLDLGGGTHNMVGRAVDAAGRESVDSTASSGSTVTVEVVQDAEPPAVVAEKPTPPVVLADTAIRGTATDNARVLQVVVTISDLRNGQNVGGDSGQSTVLIQTFTCAPDPMCPPGSVPWSFVLRPTSRLKFGPLPTETGPRVIGLNSGLFNVRIVAYDAWLNASTAETFDVAVVAPPRIG